MNGPRYREGQQIEIGALARQCHAMRLWIAALVVVTAITAFAAAVANVKACESRHKIVEAGERILPTRPQLEEMLRRGRITREQFDRGVRNLAAWRAADCHWNHTIAP